MNSQPSKQTALITGASGGIGLELAKIFARHGHNLVIVARSQDKLASQARELASQHDISVKVLAKDLADPAAPRDIYRQLQQESIQIDVLVNNAGFATYGFLAELDLDGELAMMQVNIVALTHLTRLFLPDMLERKRGRILNVASTAAFQPGPLMAVYYASKAYVLSFSEAIANELQGTGVTVTALCPGPTRTGFQARADMEDSKLVQGGLMDAATVAEAGYKALMQGETVVVPGLLNKLRAFAVRLVPDRVAARFVRKIQEPIHNRH
jgi:short-subunit dehydrogenase